VGEAEGEGVDWGRVEGKRRGDLRWEMGGKGGGMSREGCRGGLSLIVYC